MILDREDRNRLAEIAKRHQKNEEELQEPKVEKATPKASIIQDVPETKYSLVGEEELIIRHGGEINIRHVYTDEEQSSGGVSLTIPILVMIAAIIVASNFKNITDPLANFSKTYTQKSGEKLINRKNVENPIVTPEEYEKMSNEEKREYQEKCYEYIAPLAIEIKDEFGTYPSALMGQWAIESTYGTSVTAVEDNNYFGIKAYGDPNKYWNGDKNTHDTPNDANPRSDFRVYPDMETSIKDYARLIGKTDYYKPARKCYDEGKGPKAQLKEIERLGYAEGSNYGDVVYNNYIEPFNLEKYDNMSLEEFWEWKNNKKSAVVTVPFEEESQTIVFDDKAKRFITKQEDEGITI